ncbi:MAG TPA: hypothetical protein ENK02_11720 [Planctomycetes bacterium]|nr:hypothetical protein [Planctomycetota bacterium]
MNPNLSRRKPSASFLLPLLLAASPLLAQNTSIPKVGTVRAFPFVSPNGINRGTSPVLVTEKVIRFQDASFLQVEFSQIRLQKGSYLEVESLFDDQKQTWTWNRIQEIGMHSYYFNGDSVRIRLFAGPKTEKNFFAIRSVAVGNSTHHLPPLSLCGTIDKRVRSFDRRVARLLIRVGSQVGVCTGWLISPVNCFATAGHCFAGSVSLVTVQFNVPLSLRTGFFVNPPLSSQYNWEGSTRRIFENKGKGKDWGVFSTLKNAKTGRYPGSVQQSHFLFASIPSNGTLLRVTGHGTDSSPKTFNYVQQTHNGPQKKLGSSFIGYRVDTMSGNSGSPVMISFSGRAIAVHTHGGCGTSSTSFNGGTRQDYAPFASARSRICTRRPLPDLRAESVSGPDPLIAGNSVTVSSRIFNAGTASSPSTVSGYFISTNSIISTADRLIASFTTNPLAIGGSHLHSTALRLPRDLQNGSCFLGVFADRLHRLPEENETNNGLGVKRTCRGLPDLLIKSLSSTSLSAGGVAAITSSVRNNGKTSANSSFTGILLSLNSTITTSDDYLGGYATGSLAPGALKTVTSRHAIPFCYATGRYFVGAIADIGRIISESDESNNTRAIPVSLTGYAGSKRMIQFVPRFGTMAQSTTFASYSARKGGKAKMCITAPRLGGHWYYCLWSSRSFPFQFDSLTRISIGLVNIPPFTNWFGKLDLKGRGFPAWDAAGHGTLSKGFTTFTHVLFFTPTFSAISGFSSNSVRTLIRR